jgi:hypothetical protein
MRYFLFFVSAGFLFLFFSCKKYSPAPAAFFITSDRVTVAPTSSQGSASHKISDLYLYVDGQFQGAYPVGHTMPIVNKNSSVKLDVFAGIKNNGISDLSITTFFYDRITFDTLVESGTTISRPFTFKYNPNVKFVWLENFDNPLGFSLIKSSNSDTTYKVISGADAFEGKSAELGLNGGLVGQVESAASYTLPYGNSNVYLELDYKCNTDFMVGLTDGVNTKPALMVKAHDSWNKIYIQLAHAINDAPKLSSYKVFFHVTANETSTPRVWLDNIKLVYL